MKRRETEGMLSAVFFYKLVASSLTQQMHSLATAILYCCQTYRPIALGFISSNSSLSHSLYRGVEPFWYHPGDGYRMGWRHVAASPRELHGSWFSAPALMQIGGSCNSHPSYSPSLILTWFSAPAFKQIGDGCNSLSSLSLICSIQYVSFEIRKDIIHHKVISLSW